MTREVVDEQNLGTRPRGFSKARYIEPEVAALIGDPGRRNELGTQARDYVLEHYPLSAAIERTEDYYRKVRERVIA